MKGNALLIFLVSVYLFLSASSWGRAINTAEKALEAGHYEYAYAQWKKILSQKPGNRTAQEGLARLQAIAKDLYGEALRVPFSDPDRRKDLLRTVILISDPTSEINRVARKVLGDDL